ncbi:V-type ATP synthase subunit I [Chlamydia pneumoniae]|uniref:V-type ATP synthase subunit I n=1 Tax=Chlamydia pneumoniae TaxID=83558 RepID=A0A0F7YQ63_CHLPN|nr:V-type ATP synthase subunit I [Chlamydia pneumoniae]BAA98301.1 ATP synthase subunit I [Chlamydia pneumoniae J138]CRI35449.1 V-type ATP synthase subunit I [Chlamydia pneumoniae]CRI41096.1 V-type ATP synthase subunit I [Chlamydia pneumoniae]CRI72731.1 V-type ATP synthase subunit I [Chlamydia pneumoniae]
MRLNIHKYLFIGRNKADFFSASRELGVVEFISKKCFITTEQGHRFVECLKVFDHLEAEYSLEALEFVKDESVSVEDIVSEVLTLNKEIKGLLETVKALRKEIVRVKPLGAFSSSEIAELSRKTGISLRFFYRTHKDNEDLEEDSPNVFYLSTAYNFDYYLVLGVVDLPRDRYTEIEAPRSVNELQVDLANLQREIRNRSDRLCDLYAYRREVLRGLCNYDNEQRLHQAKECCEDLFDGKVFAVAGWVIVDRIKELQSLCNRYQIYMERVPVDPDETIPTYLENKGVGVMGEDLVQIYDTPAYSDKDPSTWVFFAFVLFFSMIVNDAGYGLLFLMSSLLFSWKFRRKMKFSKHLSRMLKMTAILGLGCICWGTTTTSFFGMSFSKTSVFREYSMTHVLALKKAEYYLQMRPKAYKELTNEYPSLKAIRDPKAFLLATEIGSAGIESRYVVYDKFIDNILMELALFIGVVHLSLGMLRYLRYRYSGIGWILFMVSAYLYVPIYLGTVSLIHYLFHVPYELGGQIGYYGMFGGIGLAVVLAMIQRSWRGVEEIISVIQVFSDVLSYLRIYALGLAGAMMGATFNQMGARLPMLLGSIVILLGHSVNIILSIMGGVIHGLRLNFIEWYHYSFDGGGRPLRPLRKIVCSEDAEASGIHLDNNSIV